MSRGAVGPARRSRSHLNVPLFGFIYPLSDVWQRIYNYNVDRIQGILDPFICDLGLIIGIDEIY
jgi:hypothetical protein